MTKETTYLSFIENLMENMDNKQLVELHKEMYASRAELLAEYYNLVAVQGMFTDADLVVATKQKIEVFNVLIIKANTWI